MLCELVVRDFAIIHRAHISFYEGLNLLTGETGAGKSIVVGAVNLLLGSRASQEMIRGGARETTVEALFRFKDPRHVDSRFAMVGLDPAEELVIRRTVTRSGRNRVVANGVLITVQQLRSLTRGLLSISGQHEHQLLLNPDIHLDLLDMYAGVGEKVRWVASKYERWRHVEEELHRWEKLRRQEKDRMDFLRHQLAELESATLVPDEDTELEKEQHILQHAADLHQAAVGAHNLLYAERGAVVELLDETAQLIDKILQVDPGQDHLSQHLEQARIHVEELSHELSGYASAISFDPARLAEVEDRLAIIRKLCKKYGASVNELIAKREELRTAVMDEASYEDRLTSLKHEIHQARDEYLDAALTLSLERKSAATELQKDVHGVLKRLDLPNVTFQVSFLEDTEGDPDLAQEINPGPKGIDRVEFFLSTNPGQPVKPLAKIASGGELSRILLALKSILGLKEEAETLIFDEVDTGIGGRTAELVGRQLLRLSEHHQVICITHLPQIACYGDHHFRVIKRSRKEETTVEIENLSEDGRVQEIARMLGGVKITKKTRDHAREWLNKAKKRPQE